MSPESKSDSSLWQETPQAGKFSRIAPGSGYGPRPSGSGEGWKFTAYLRYGRQSPIRHW